MSEYKTDNFKPVRSAVTGRLAQMLVPLQTGGMGTLLNDETIPLVELILQIKLVTPEDLILSEPFVNDKPHTIQYGKPQDLRDYKVLGPLMWADCLIGVK
jgi:hypothetical protein